jgi:hypothetical protein
LSLDQVGDGVGLIISSEPQSAVMVPMSTGNPLKVIVLPSLAVAESETAADPTRPKRVAAASRRCRAYHCPYRGCDEALAPKPAACFRHTSDGGAAQAKQQRDEQSGQPKV